MRKDQWIAGGILTTLIGWAGWSWVSGGIIGVILDTGMDSAEKVAALGEFVQGWGALAPAVYVGIVVVEAVVAPIPGAILYLPGGMIFGGFWGGTLSLAGNILGAGICCLLMRTLAGRRWSGAFFTAGRLEGARRFILKHGILSIAILRVNPLTSSDIVSYAAGLTPLSTLTVMIGTAIGMTPLCYAQAYLSMGLFALFPWLIWPLVAASALYVVLAVLAIWRLKPPRPVAASGGSDE